MATREILSYRGVSAIYTGTQVRTYRYLKNIYFWRKASFILKSAGLTEFFSLRCRNFMTFMIENAIQFNTENQKPVITMQITK